MSERVKKILLVTAFIVVTVGIAVALYLVFFRPAALVEEEVIIEDGVVTGLPTAEEGLPTTIIPEEADELVASEIARGGLTAVTSLTTGRVGSTSINPDGSSMNYYDPSDDHFYRINEDGTATQLSDQKFPDVDSVAWANQGDKAVIEFPDGSNVVYNFETEVQVTLPSHWEDFDFSPSGSEIVTKSLGVDPNNRWLVITSDDGTRTQGMAALGNNEDQVQVNWSPNDQVIAFSDTGPAQTGFGRKMILPIGKSEENFKGLVVEGFGFEAQWSPRGDQILYSVSGQTNDYKPTLWLVDGSGDDMGDNRRNLGIETWVDKCTFSSASSILCAVPQNLPSNSGIQRALADDTFDYVYEVDLSSGVSSLLAIPDDDVSMESLTLSDDGSTLFFTDADSGILQMIKLQ